MKKWLVGLSALACVAATSFAEGAATLPVEENYTATQDWTALTGFSGSGVGTYGDGRCKFDSNNDWLMVQFDGEASELSFDVKGNSASAGTEPASFLVEQSADAETWAMVVNLDETAFSTSYAPFGPYALASESRYVRWTYVNKYGFNLGLNNVKITSGGPVEFGIALNPAEDFDVVQGKSASITATVKGAQGDVTYSWSVDGNPIDLAGNVYEINSDEVGGPYTVVCEADDGVSAPVSASVKYSVVEAPVVDGDQLTRADTGVTGSSYQDWTAEGASGTKYAGNSAGGNESIQLRSTSPSGIVITESAGKDVASVKLEWNTEKTDPSRVVQVYGRTEAYAGPAELYGDDKGTPLGEIGVSATTVEVPEGYPYIGIRSKDKALYLTSVTIGFAGASNPSISYTGETTAELPDAAFELVFTLKNYEGDYSWSLVDGEGTLGEGGVYTWTATEAGEYTVKVAAVNGELVIAQKEVTLTAVAKYTVSVADGIENGSVELKVDGATVESPAQLAAGTQVTVVATADQGYQLDQILLNGQELEANPFTVESDAEISATFSEKPVLPGVTYTITGTNSAEITSGEAPEGSSFEYASTYNKIYQLTAPNSMTLTLKGYEGQKVTGLTLSMHSNGSKGAGSLSATCGDATIASIADSAFKGNWYTDYTTNWVAVTPEVTATEIDDDIVITITASVNSLYCESITVEYEAAGPATPSIAYTGETEKTLPDAAFELVFTLKNYEGDYSWSLVDGEGTLGEGGVYTWTATEAGEYTVKVAAVNGELVIAQKEVTLTAIAAYTVSVADGIENGSVELEVDGATVESPAQLAAGTQVTVVATADQGYQLDQILLNGQELEANPFTVESDAEISATFSEKPVLPGVTYTITGTNSAEITSGEAPEGSSFEYASTYNKIYQLTAPNSMTLTLKGYEGQKVTGLTLSMHSNGSKGSGSLSATCGDATIASIADSAFKGNWYTDYTTNWVAVTPEVTATEIDDDIVITITASVNSLYCESITVEYEAAGPATPSIAYTGETEKRLPDAAFELVFTLKNYEGDFAWSLVEGEGSLGEGGVYTWTATEAGEYTIKVAAINGGLTIAQKEVMLTAVATYPITVERVPGGVLSVDKDQAEAGDSITVTADPDEGMKLTEITVKGETTDLSFTSSPAEFAMPAEAVTVSATFEEFEVPPYYFQFETNDLPTAYSATSADVANTGAATEVATVPFTLQRAVRGNAAGDKKVGTAALRLAPLDATNAYAFNSAAFSEAVTAISFQYGIYGTSDKCDSFTVSTSEDGENWTVLADLTATATAELQTFESELPDNTLYIRFDATNSVAGNTRRMDIDEIMLWTGAPAPKITYNGETTIELGESFDLNFELKNYDGASEWALDGEGSIADDGLYTWTPGQDDVGTHTIKVSAVNGELLIASKEVVLTVTEPGPQPGEPAIQYDGPETGVVGEELTCTVWAINMQNPMVEVTDYDTPDGSSLAEVDIHFDGSVCTFTPDVAGVYWIEFCAYEGDSDAGICDKWTVTVSEPGPGPQPTVYQITKLTKSGGNLVLTYEPEGTPAVLGTASLASPQEWTTVEGAVAGGTTATVPMGAQRYITLK